MPRRKAPNAVARMDDTKRTLDEENVSFGAIVIGDVNTLIDMRTVNALVIGFTVIQLLS